MDLPPEFRLYQVQQTFNSEVLLRRMFWQMQTFSYVVKKYRINRHIHRFIDGTKKDISYYIINRKYLYHFLMELFVWQCTAEEKTWNKHTCVIGVKIIRSPGQGSLNCEKIALLDWTPFWILESRHKNISWCHHIIVMIPLLWLNTVNGTQ